MCLPDNKKNEFYPYPDKEEHDYINKMTSIIARARLVIKDASMVVDILQDVVEQHIKTSKTGGDNMIVRQAYYKAQWYKIVDIIIAGWTWPMNIKTPPYSHVEQGFKVNGKWKYFSSTMRTKPDGTRWIDEKALLKNPERWDVYEYTVSSSEAKEMLNRAKYYEKRRYDRLGIFGFTIPFINIHNKKKVYCSEIVNKINFDCWQKISPRRLFSKMVRNAKPSFKKIS